MSAGSLKRWVADIHLWLSLVVGLQVLAWMVSGLFMVSAPIERVRSEHRMAEPVHADLAAHGALVAPDQLMSEMGAPVERMSLELVGERLLYAVEGADEQKALFDAQTGARVSPIDEVFARQIAEAAIAGDAPAARVTLIEQSPPIKYRGGLPVWRADFADSDKSLRLRRSQYRARHRAPFGLVARVRHHVGASHHGLWRARSAVDHRHRLGLGDDHLRMVLLAIRLPQRIRRKTAEKPS